MKNKSIIILTLTLLITSHLAHAKTEVTGNVYDQVFGIMDLNDSGSLYGVNIDDLNEASENCDNTKKICYMSGFSWSDVVGWTTWDGKALQTELGGSAQFPDEYIAKAAYNGNLGGFIWGEKYGWIQLSACSGINNQANCQSKNYCQWTINNHCEIDSTTIVPRIESQDINNWGAYLDLCPLKTSQSDCESAKSNDYCNWDASDNLCVFDQQNNPNGQPFDGYAWSEYLGWIKFRPATGETEFQGVLTNWFPDLTPPDIKIGPGGNPPSPLNFWIPVENTSGSISWNGFADENDSYVDLHESKIIVTKSSDSNFTTCPDSTIQTNGNAIISTDGTGSINLHIPGVGIIGRPPKGFCKYNVSGALYNASGYAYYFGSEADNLAIVDGVDTNNPSPNSLNNSPITLNIRAGILSSSTSLISVDSNDELLADGNNFFETSFSPKDTANNPIISVEADLKGDITNTESDWIRKVETLFDLNEKIYTFDSVDQGRDIYLQNPQPIKIEEGEYSYNTPLQYTMSDDTSGSYTFDLKGYAPTVGDNQLELSNIQVSTNDKELPAISEIQGPWAESTNPTVLNSNLSGLPHNYRYQPVLEVTAGSLDSDFITLSQVSTANFIYQNNSLSSDLEKYSFDNILSFHSIGGGFSGQMLEVEGIDLTNLNEDTHGRTDPVGICTRYEVLYSDNSSLLSPQSNAFHNNTSNFHEPKFDFEQTVDANGVYKVSGEYYVSPNDTCRNTHSCADVEIDRTDPLDKAISVNSPDSFEFQFIPSKFIGGASPTKATFDIEQYLSYKISSDFAQNVVYPAETFIKDAQVKSMGVNTNGTVEGEQIYNSGGGRDLKVVSTSSSLDLRKEIRRNVASITRTITACTAKDLDSLPTSNTGTENCIIKDDTNKTVITYYKGDNTNRLLSLTNSGNNISIPNGYHYTLIIEGADLSIEENLVYPASKNTSFGMIVMQDKDGKGGNVYIDPKPTNIVGLLYAEGSLISAKHLPGEMDIYYTMAGPSTSELNHQLFWQGSIASKNTIGGTPQQIIPEGVDCSGWDDDEANCSQAHDLDFIRRFTTINKGGFEVSPDGYVFSGGGSCTFANDPKCVMGSLPSTVTLASSSNTIEPNTSKSLDAFFIERDDRPVPPGFSNKGGFTSSTEIR